MREMRGDAEREQLRESLVAYARAHPGASDTMEGIRSFWLQSQTGCSPENLERVLADLVSMGVFVVKRLPDGTLLYSVKGADPFT